MNSENRFDLAGFFVDGRPLHAYRIDDTLHSRLEAEIREKLTTRRFVSAAAPFVLWAAERYRKDYDGGPLSWEFLTEPLGVNLAQENLREITREGLAKLRRSVRRGDGGTQYLRTIAAEGGIPVRLLSGQGGGYRAALVGLVADLSRIGFGCPRDVALGFAARRTSRLPVGYRTPEFHELFVTFAFEILELRALAPEGMTPHEVEPFLDRVKPGWRNAMSLRFDGDAARNLLSEAVLVTARHGLVADPLIRVLHRGEVDHWVPWVEVREVAELAPQLVPGIEPERRRLRMAPVGHLASTVPDLLFALERDKPDMPWDIRRISGRRTARFQLPLDTAAEFIAMADGDFLGRIRLPGGEAVNFSVGPTFWRLAEMGQDAAQALAYAGNASLRTRDPHIWLLTQAGGEPHCTDTLTAEPDGVVAGGVLWRLSGQGRVLAAGGNARIETYAEAEERDEIHATGALDYRVLDARGAPVHRGVPSIFFRRAGRGFRQLVGTNLRHRLDGSLRWRPGVPTEATIGRVTLAVREDAGVGAHVTINMVPKGFSVRELTRGNDPRRKIRFEGVPQGCVLRLDGCMPIQADDDGVVEAVLDEAVGQRGRLPLTLAGSDGSAPIEWALDLPRGRGEFQSIRGATLTADRDISMQALKDWRIVPADGRRTDLQIRLHAASVAGAPIIGKRVTTEQPLSALRPLLEEMLVTGGADAELRLRVVTDGDHSPRLRLRHGLGETRLVGEDVLVTEGLTATYDRALQITAIDLDDPARVFQAGARGLSHLGEGRWFLLPHRNGVPMRPPRPFVLPEPQCCEDENSRRRLDRVQYLANHLRGENIDEVLSRLAMLTGRLLEQGVSPSALDQTHALALVPAAAVRLLMKVGASDLEDALSLELHGGPRWPFVHPDAWMQGFKDEADSLRATLATLPSLADKATGLVREALVARAADILRLRPSLEGHIALALLQVDGAALGDLAHRLGGLSPGLQSPAAALLAAAHTVVSRNAALAPTLHDLAARNRPLGFEAFHPDLRGLIEAPLVVAEIAFGLRPAPTTREKIELLQAIHTDVGGFEAALPAAIAWLANRKTEEDKT